MPQSNDPAESEKGVLSMEILLLSRQAVIPSLRLDKLFGAGRSNGYICYYSLNGMYKSLCLIGIIEHEFSFNITLA